MNSWRWTIVAVGMLIVAVALGLIRWSGKSPRPNIILVTFDTTRSDHLGAYGYQHGLTTAFDEFARRGVLFERAYAPCPITLPSHTSMLTGLYPPEHDLRINGSGKLSTKIPFLPEILKEHGYDTGAFIAAAPVLGAQFGLNRGFDRYDDEPAQKSTHARAYGGERRDGEEVVDLALAWLKERTAHPFFCWIHLYDAHGPYDPFTDVYQNRFQESPYDAGVAWEVQQFGRVNDYLVDQHLDTNTLVIVAGDHGEGLNDHGEHEHGMLVYDTTLHVPLIFAGSNFCQPGTRVSGNVSLVDLMPTVLDLLEISLPDRLSGRSLVPAMRGGVLEPRDCYAEAEMPYFLNRWCPLRAVISDHWKYIQSTRPELYNLENDPGELANLIDTADSERQKLRSLLTAIEGRFTRTRADDVELSEEDVANLQSLGYVAGPSVSHGDLPEADEKLIDIKDMVPFVSKFEEAKHMAASGDVDKAIAMLEEVARATNDYPMSDLSLGELLADSGRQDEALVLFRSVLERRPDFLKARFSLGRILASRGQFDEAGEQFQEILRDAPYDSTAHYELGRILAQTKRFNDAILEFREALRLAPEMVIANVTLGQLFTALQRPSEAAPYLERALELDPDNVPALEYLMMVYAQTGQLDLGIKLGKRAVRLNPDSFESRFNLGLMLVQAHQFAEGISQLRQAQRIRPEDPRATQQIDQAEAAMQAVGK